jgi:hypothetical protein
MGGAPLFQAVQHPELDKLGIMAIHDFLKKRARYLRLVAQNNKADGVNVSGRRQRHAYHSGVFD